MEQERLDEIEANLSHYADRRLVGELVSEIKNLRARLTMIEYSSHQLQAQALLEAADDITHGDHVLTGNRWAIALWLRSRARRVAAQTVRGDVQDDPTTQGEGRK